MGILIINVYPDSSKKVPVTIVGSELTTSWMLDKGKEYSLEGDSRKVKILTPGQQSQEKLVYNFAFVM